jgi:hypothetical protein
MVESLKMAEKLWDLANLVTGFAVAQSLAFTYGMAKHDMKMPGLAAHWMAAIGTIVFTVGYGVAVVLCYIKGRSLDAAANAVVWKWVMFGRVLTVSMFAAVTLVTIYFHWRDEDRTRRLRNHANALDFLF